MPSANAKLLAFGLAQSSLASGIIYGWPGLVLILKADGMYAPLCEEVGSAAGASGGSAGGCPAQTQALSDLFNVAQACLTGAMVFNGTLIDRFGPRLASCMGSTLVALASILFALLPLPTPGDGVDTAMVCLCLMAVGGSGVHLSWFHTANLFPEKRQTISSIIIAGFVGSGAVFPLWQLLDDAAPDFGRREIFLLHGILVACTVPLAVRLWPDTPFNVGDTIRFTGWTLAWEVEPAAKTATDPAAAAASADAEKDNDAGDEQDKDEAAPRHETKILLKESEMELCDQLKQPSFYLMLLFFSVHFFRYIWLLGTLLAQFETKGSADAARAYTKATGWILPLAAFGQPFVGMLLDKYGFARGFLVVVVCGTVYSVFILFHLLEMQIMMIPFLSAFRKLISHNL